MIRVSTVNEANAEVAWRAYDLMSEQQGLRTTTAEIEIVGDKESLTLLGRVRTAILYDLADRLAHQAAGSLPVENRLISDEDLTMEIANRLGTDPRTADAEVRIDVFLGVARLAGNVSADGKRAAVLELAADVPGVTRVEDHTSIAR